MQNCCHFAVPLNILTCEGCCVQFEAMEQFLGILDAYIHGKPLYNIVDKKVGY